MGAVISFVVTHVFWALACFFFYRTGMWRGRTIELKRATAFALEVGGAVATYHHLLDRHWHCYRRLSTAAREEFTSLWAEGENQQPPH